MSSYLENFRPAKHLRTLNTRNLLRPPIPVYSSEKCVAIVANSLVSFTSLNVIGGSNRGSTVYSSVSGGGSSRSACAKKRFQIRLSSRPTRPESRWCTPELH